MKFTKVVKADENFDLDLELSKFIEDLKADNEGLNEWINQYSKDDIEHLKDVLKFMPMFIKEDLVKYRKLIAKRINQYKAVKQIIENSGK